MFPFSFVIILQVLNALAIGLPGAQWAYFAFVLWGVTQSALLFTFVFFIRPPAG